MNIMVVDDERLVVEQMVGLLRQVEPEADIVGFSEPEEACSYLEKCRVDVAFLDVEMGELDQWLSDEAGQRGGTAGGIT